MSRLWLLLAVAASTLPVCVLVNHFVPDPYMDEIFHIPQAQQYCRGDFQRWDPMITTLPGLYLVSLAYASFFRLDFQLMGLPMYLPDLCSPFILRSVNIALAFVCTLLFREISLQLDPSISDRMASVKALALAWYPLHWFFTFLYYTDVGSTTAVMAMYLACLKKAYWTSGLLGFVAILFRQTNAVWTVFVACVGVFHFLQDKNSEEHFFDETVGPSAASKTELYGGLSQDVAAMQLRRRPHVLATVGSSEASSKSEQHWPLDNGRLARQQGLMGEILLMAQWAWHRRWDVIQQFLPLVLVVLAFIAFVFYNGSIVLGAKDAHKASLHFSQVLYFGVASAVALAPIHFTPCWIYANLWNLRRRSRRGLLCYLAAGFIAALICVHFFSFAHPYLLSDNRHYTFYIWRKLVNAHWIVKYLLVPIYVFAWFSIIVKLGKRETKLWIFIFCLGVVGVLVPAPLIEFRYFTIPFYFIALHTPTNKHHFCAIWLFIAFEYLALNILTMYTFLFKAFYWSNTTEPQRFIW